VLLKWKWNWEKSGRNRFISHEVYIFFCNTHKNEIVWCFNFWNAKCHTFAYLIIPTLISLDIHDNKNVCIWIWRKGLKLMEIDGMYLILGGF
jgi:hypothetical protein